MVGCVVSSLCSLWLAIGTFIVRPHRESLPTSIDRCNVSSAADMCTPSNVTLASAAFGGYGPAAGPAAGTTAAVPTYFQHL